MMARHNIWRHPESPWLVVSGLVLVLALVDRLFILDQSSSVDRMLDWATIICATAGSGCSWIVSYRAPFRSTVEPGATIAIRIFFCWMLGPILTVGAACFAEDIDGGLLLFYPPVVGLLLAAFVLPFLLFRRRQRAANPTRKASASSGGTDKTQRLN